MRLSRKNVSNSSLKIDKTCTHKANIVFHGGSFKSHYYFWWKFWEIFIIVFVYPSHVFVLSALFLFIIIEHCMYLFIYLISVYWTTSVFDIDYGKCWKCSIESSFLWNLIFDGMKQIILEGIYIYIYLYKVWKNFLSLKK